MANQIMLDMDYDDAAIDADIDAWIAADTVDRLSDDDLIKNLCEIWAKDVKPALDKIVDKIGKWWLRAIAKFGLRVLDRYIKKLCEG